MKVHVTDHATLRFLERNMGINIEAVRKKIASDCEHAAKAGAASLYKDGLRYILDRGAVITVIK